MQGEKEEMAADQERAGLREGKQGQEAAVT